MLSMYSHPIPPSLTESTCNDVALDVQTASCKAAATLADKKASVLEYAAIFSGIVQDSQAYSCANSGTYPNDPATIAITFLIQRIRILLILLTIRILLRRHLLTDGQNQGSHGHYQDAYSEDQGPHGQDRRARKHQDAYR